MPARRAQSWAQSELRLRQGRLGTDAERPEDFRVIRDLIHLLHDRREAEAILARLKAFQPSKHDALRRITARE